MKKLIMLSAIFFCTQSVAMSNVISSVSINDSVVIITTAQSRTENIAACSLNENSNKWAFSLTSSEGKNLYRAVITAHAAGRIVDITAAGDCQALDGIERLQAIEINFL
jgi:hypothetical protein